MMLVSCNQQPGGEPVTRIDFENMDGTKSAGATTAPSPTPTAAQGPCEKVTFEEVQLTHCVANPVKHSMRTVLAGEDGAPLRSFSALQTSLPKDTKIAFAINAGAFDGEGKPVGYYVENGNRIKELDRSDGQGNFYLKPNGVFYGTGSTWRIRTSDDFYSSVGDRPAWGTQSGPMLVIKGKLHPKISEDGPSKSIRSGVGLDAKGNAHFVISDAPLSYGVLARYFRDGLKTPNALFLDSQRSSLWDPANGRMDTNARIGPILLVTDK
ncbi:MAG: phosphodiester glycosidase family protein [Sphingomonadaceae bacterium]